MEKQYDRKCIKCESCHYYQPAGKRNSTIDPDAIWPEACGLWATAFGKREPAEDCSGYMTEKDYQIYQQRKKLKKK